MKINPCPNPGCNPSIYGNGPKVWNRGGEYRGVTCGCGLSGPTCASEWAAIAAWNSISMGWINAKDKEPPRDGAKFIGFDVDDCGEIVDLDRYWFNGATWQGDCHEPSGTPPQFYNPIPPTSEGK